MEEAREAVWELRSGGHPQCDFYEAVRRGGEQITRATPVRFSVTTTGIRQTVPPATQEELLKIVLEALRNVVRHARATEVGVDVSFPAPGNLALEIWDDGCGFDVAVASRKKGHCGLASMRERARNLEAEFDMMSIPAQGTRIRINLRNLPLEESSISNV
jgi:signal transduction histidine kinase